MSADRPSAQLRTARTNDTQHPVRGHILISYRMRAAPWFPAPQRARALSRFLTAIPLSAAIGNPLSAWLLGFDGLRGLAGWQWLFLLEGIPPVLLGFAVLAFLPDQPAGARWLPVEQRDWLTARLRRDADESPAPLCSRTLG
jgi:MFS family permease